MEVKSQSEDFLSGAKIDREIFDLWRSPQKLEAFYSVIRGDIEVKTRKKYNKTYVRSFKGTDFVKNIVKNFSYLSQNDAVLLLHIFVYFNYAKPARNSTCVSVGKISTELLAVMSEKKGLVYALGLDGIYCFVRDESTTELDIERGLEIRSDLNSGHLPDSLFDDIFNWKFGMPLRNPKKTKGIDHPFFTGVEGVKWIMSNFKIEKVTACIILQYILEQGIIYGETEVDFYDHNTLYYVDLRKYSHIIQKQQFIEFEYIGEYHITLITATSTNDEKFYCRLHLHNSNDETPKINGTSNLNQRFQYSVQKEKTSLYLSAWTTDHRFLGRKQVRCANTNPLVVHQKEFQLSLNKKCTVSILADITYIPYQNSSIYDDLRNFICSELDILELFQMSLGSSQHDDIITKSLKLVLKDGRIVEYMKLIISRQISHYDSSDMQFLLEETPLKNILISYFQTMGTSYLTQTLRYYVTSIQNQIEKFETLDTVELGSIEENSSLKSVFDKFISDIRANENIDFWRKVNLFESTKNKVLREELGKDIFRTYVKLGSPEQVNFDDKIVSDIQANLNNEILPDFFQPAKDWVTFLIQSDTFPKFLRSEVYLNYVEMSAHKTEEAIDILLQYIDQILRDLVLSISNIDEGLIELLSYLLPSISFFSDISISPGRICLLYLICPALCAPYKYDLIQKKPSRFLLKILNQLSSMIKYIIIQSELPETDIDIQQKLDQVSPKYSDFLSRIDNEIYELMDKRVSVKLTSLPPLGFKDYSLLHRKFLQNRKNIQILSLEMMDPDISMKLFKKFDRVLESVPPSHFPLEANDLMDIDYAIIAKYLVYNVKHSSINPFKTSGLIAWLFDKISSTRKEALYIVENIFKLGMISVLHGNKTIIEDDSGQSLKLDLEITESYISSINITEEIFQSDYDAVKLSQKLLFRFLNLLNNNSNGFLEPTVIYSIIHTPEFTEIEKLASSLSDISLDGLNNDELQSFWLNIYHALFLHGLIKYGVPFSVLDKVLFYAKSAYRIGQWDYSLLIIENSILKQDGAFNRLIKLNWTVDLNDPRLQYSVDVDSPLFLVMNCGSTHCARIQVYKPEYLEKMKKASVKNYITNVTKIYEKTNKIMYPEYLSWGIENLLESDYCPSSIKKKIAELENPDICLYHFIWNFSFGFTRE